MKFFFALISLLISPLIQSQNSLEGYIVNKNGVEIPYVSVRVLLSDSTFVCGTATDSTGYFNINNLKKGSHILSLSCIGFSNLIETIQINEGKTHLPIIRLSDNDFMIGEVEVKASPFIRKNDHVVIIPDKQQIKHGSTGYDLLYNLMIPNITVDKQKGDVSTLGGKVTLYINGRKVDYQEIRALQPKDIERVEYFDTPIGQYTGDIASINYVMKQYNQGGYVAIDGKQTLGYLHGDYNVVGKLSTAKVNYTLLGGYNMEKYNGVKNEMIETFIFPEYTVNRENMTLDAQTKNDAYYTQLNIQNNNPNNKLTTKIAFVGNNTPDNFQNNNLAYTGHFNKSTISNNAYSETSYRPSISINGGFNLKNKHYMDVTLSSSFTSSSYSRTYKEPGFSSLSNVDEDFYNIDADFLYSIPFKHQNSLTFKLSHYQKISSADYSGDYNMKQNLRSGETLLFLNYSQALKQFFLMIQPGISSLFYKVGNNDRIIQVSPRANVMLNYQLSQKQQIQLSLTIGNSYPQMSTMNSADQNVDFILMKRGNPNLKTTGIYNGAILYNLYISNFTLQAMGICNLFKNITGFDYFVENNKMISSYRSDEDYRQILGVIFATWKIRKDLHLKAEIAGIHSEVTGYVKAMQNTFRMSLDLNYYWKDFAVNVFGKIPEKVLNPGPIFQRSSTRYGLSASWNHKGWTVELGTDTPFTRSCTTTYSTKTPNYENKKTSYSRNFQQTGYMKIAYIFDFGRKVSRTQDKVNTQVGSAILKAD